MTSAIFGSRIWLTTVVDVSRIKYWAAWSKSLAIPFIRTMYVVQWFLNHRRCLDEMICMNVCIANVSNRHRLFIRSAGNIWMRLCVLSLHVVWKNKISILVSKVRVIDQGHEKWETIFSSHWFYKHIFTLLLKPPSMKYTIYRQ